MATALEIDDYDVESLGSGAMSFNKRQENLDLFKTVAIFGVIVYHLGAEGTSRALMNSGPSTLNWINYALLGFGSLCMPIFFVTNGILLFRRPLNIHKHLKKIVALMVLTVFWSVVTQIIFGFTGVWEGPLSLTDFIKNTYNLPFPLNNHLWFMGALVLIYFFFPLLKATYDFKPQWFYFFFIIVILTTVGNNIIQMGVDLGQLLINQDIGGQSSRNYFGYFNPSTAFKGNALTYFLIGGLLANPSTNQKVFSWIRQYSWIIFILSMSLYFCFNVLLFFGGLTERDVFGGGYYSPFIVTAIIAIFMGTEKLKLHGWFARFIQFCGKNTFPVYFIHWIFIGVLKHYGLEIPIFGGLTVFSYALFSVPLFLICLLVSRALKKIPGVRRVVMI